MALRTSLLAAGMFFAAAPLSATTQHLEPTAAAPAGTAGTRYCMRVEAITGSRIETIECWTRAEWAEQGVDVDQEWAKEGVEVQG